MIEPSTKLKVESCNGIVCTTPNTVFVKSCTNLSEDFQLASSIESEDRNLSVFSVTGLFSESIKSFTAKLLLESVDASIFHTAVAS